MHFESTFNPRDRVYKITQLRETEWLPCVFCEGSGNITGANGSQRFCPECFGRGGNTIYKEMRWEVEPEPLTIGQIRIEFTPESTENISDLFDNYKAQKEKYVESYMCYESGIGTGSIYYMPDLFLSIEDAQAECDKRNAWVG